MKFFTTLQKQQQHQGLLQKRNPIPHQTNAQRFLCGIEKKCSFPNEGICSKTMSSYILQILLISTKIIPSNIINTKSNLNYNKEAMQEEGTLLHDLPLSLQKKIQYQSPPMSRSPISTLESQKILSHHSLYDSEGFCHLNF